MKKILVYRIKQGEFTDRTIAWDVSNLHLRNSAYVDLFNILDKELDAYSNSDSVTCALLPLARNENPEACEALLTYRRNKSGEFFEEIDLRKAISHPVLSDSPFKETKVVKIEDLTGESNC